MPDRQALTPPQIAKRYGVSPGKVLHWIKVGELRGINIAASATGRPRFVVDAADLADFEARRSARPVKPAPRRRKAPAGIIEYF